VKKKKERKEREKKPGKERRKILFVFGCCLLMVKPNIGPKSLSWTEEEEERKKKTTTIRRKRKRFFCVKNVSWRATEEKLK